MTNERATLALNVTFLGFGEAGMAFASGILDAIDVSVRVYDQKTESAAEIRDAKYADYAACNVAGCASARDAIANADVVFSLVTADQAEIAAQSAADALPEGAAYFDCNSCAPQTKKRAADIIHSAGGRYVDVAVMAPVHPALHRTPLLVSGPHARAAKAIFDQLEMRATEAVGDVGTASAIKLSRSIMVKGLEALMAEFLTTAQTLGVEDVVLESLERSHPGFGWVERIRPTLERMEVHGVRRAAEMHEAARMVRDLGLPARMAEATAFWEHDMGKEGFDVILGHASVDKTH